MTMTGFDATSNWCGKTGEGKVGVHGKPTVLVDDIWIRSRIAKFFAGIAINQPSKSPECKIRESGKEER